MDTRLLLQAYLTLFVFHCSKRDGYLETQRSLDNAFITRPSAHAQSHVFSIVYEYRKIKSLLFNISPENS